VLVEFDSIPKEKQYQVLKQSRLPLTCIIDSGSKSLHGWVRVDAENIEQYKERAEFIYKYLAAYKLDSNNKNAARYSRMPDIMRGRNKQQLIELNDIEPDAYVTWYDELTARPMVGGSSGPSLQMATCASCLYKQRTIPATSPRCHAGF
jgi:RecA-family ATPase